MCANCLENLLDNTVKPFNLAVGYWPIRLYRAHYDAVAGCAVLELLASEGGAVIGDNLLGRAVYSYDPFEKRLYAY